MESPEDSLEAHLTRHSHPSAAIYMAVVLLLLSAIVSLPLVRVGVSVQGDGIIRPALEKQELRAQTSGFVERSRLADGMNVKRGDELLKLRTTSLEARAALLRARRAEVDAGIAALEAMLSKTPEELDLTRLTPRYRAEFLQFLGERRQREIEMEQANSERVRLTRLASRDLIPRVELERIAFAAEKAKREFDQVDRRFRSGLTEALEGQRARRADLEQEAATLMEDEARLSLLAPEHGTLEQVASLSPGTFLQSGAPVGILSPEATLIAEVFVAPRDVAVVKTTDRVRLLIDAFDYNEWGFLTGRLENVSNDYVLVDDRPMFRAVVQFDSTHLTLPTGVLGELRKGMTLRARFMVAERTLWQLLRDDLTDWLNPLHHTP